MTSNFSSTCVVLALVAGQLDCQPQFKSQQQTLKGCFQQLLMSVLLFGCDNSFRDAFYCIAQPCMTAYCIHHNTFDPGTSPGSANQSILGTFI